MPTKLPYRAVFISDLHLGSSGCRADDVADFLKHVECQSLYLVGDIIDMWRLRGRWHWPESHNRVVKRLLKMAKNGTSIRMIPGNHDEHARMYAGLNFGGIQIVLSATHVTADGRRLLVTHGDQFDLAVTHARLLSILGSWAYDRLVVLNTRYNRIRARLGMKYWSLSQAIKLRVKSACNYVSRFEDALVADARTHGFDGVVCGHIHKPEIRRATVQSAEPRESGQIEYYNCGDWVENCTAIVEHDDGRMQLLSGLAFLEQIRADHFTGAPDADPDDDLALDLPGAIVRAATAT
ncbi:MAG: UDP-2,3-diacylglucosamine diphosphatase [Phycisphaerales bacterium]